MPDEYHDGTKWVALPAGFSAAADNDATLYMSLGFYKDGAQFLPQKPNTGGPFPTPFTDYDFDSADRVALRKKWVDATHKKWTEIFQVRRKDCHSDVAVRCCRYEIEVNVTLTIVATNTAEVIGVCPEGFRSNAGTFFMGDPDELTLAHESGHHMDNPDEYKGGAVDPTVNGDGAVNGIDPSSIMSDETTVKKRHYHAFNDITTTAIKNKYGRDSVYNTVDKV